MRGGPRGGFGPRGDFGRRGGWQAADLPPADDAADWFAGRLPDAWFSDVDVTVDREEITVIGTLKDETSGEGAAAEGRISRFRADTKEERIGIAEEAQARYGRKVSWGARLGDTTLVDAGVARSRSDALAWSVRLVGEHADEWLGQLREAMSEVDKLRSDGPGL